MKKKVNNENPKLFLYSKNGNYKFEETIEEFKDSHEIYIIKDDELERTILSIKSEDMLIVDSLKSITPSWEEARNIIYRLSFVNADICFDRFNLKESYSGSFIESRVLLLFMFDIENKKDSKIMRNPSKYIERILALAMGKTIRPVIVCYEGGKYGKNNI